MRMTLASSTLQIRRHGYSGDINIIILIVFVGISTLLFYAINMDADPKYKQSICIGSSKVNVSKV
ncbi:transmembrane protein, putative [Medicago truncatula]|uniref:Transmembrane protein, putative n=1 Tax=Medicago truncatula TaxID=3880 RepID=A0A072TQU0_MEDTR|nr:transmembrane protein, putative [Medicago truncatula]